MSRFVIDTQALVKFTAGKRVINEQIDEIMKNADEGENTIIIPLITNDPVILKSQFISCVK